MSITEDATIDVELLVSARGRLAGVTEYLKEGGWNDAAGWLDEAAYLCKEGAAEGDEGDGTYEDRLKAATDYADDAVTHLGTFIEETESQHARGGVRASNETVEYVLSEVRGALNDIAEWADQARKAHRDLA